MFLIITLFLLALASSGCAYYFGFYNHGLGLKWYAFVTTAIGIPIMYFFWLIMVMLILFIASLFINKKKEIKKPSKFANFLVYEVVHQINLLSNAKLHKTGLGQVPNRPCLIVYNHTSKFDPIYIMDKMHRKGIICVTKPENMRIPLAGSFIHKAGYIPVNRENDAEGMKAIIRSIDYIKKGYGCIAISPEGTRSKTKKLLPFRAGVFNIAKRAEVPIVMIGFKNTWKIAEDFPFKKTHVYMDVLGVIEYDSFKDLTTGEISDIVRKYYIDYLGEQEGE